MGLSDFKTYSDENDRAKEYITRVNEDHFESDIDLSTVEFTDSFTGRAGSYDPANYSIELSIHYLREHGWSAIEETLRHELAHAAAHQRHGDVGHGKHFRRYADELGTTRYCRSMKSTDKYLYFCPTCDASWRRKRRSNLDQKYCAECAEVLGYNKHTKIRVKELE